MNSEKLSGRYIKDTVNYDGVRAIVKNSTNENVTRDVVVRLCDDNNDSKQFDYKVNLSPNPDYPADFCASR